VGFRNLREALGAVNGRVVHDKPRVATEECASALLTELTQVRAALAEAEARSEERRLALESRIQDVGFMRIQLRVRDARISELDKEVSDLGGALARRKEQTGEAKSESAFLTQMRAALAEAEARSEERRLALESCLQDVGFMRIQLRVRDARIAELDKEVSDWGGALARRNEQIGEVKSESAALLNDTIAALTATVAERDASIAALKAMQLAEGETLAARQGDYTRAIADAEVQRRNLGALEAALAAANARLADEEAAALAAVELRNSMEAAIEEQRQRIARLEVELASVVRDRDASIAALKAAQLAEGETLAARQGDYTRAIAAANARLAEEEAAALAAVELRNSMEAANEEQRQRIARLEVELASVVRDRDASIAALKATQLAEGETLAARQGDYARAIADAEVQRKNLGALEAALATANARLAEEEAAALAAVELRNSMEAAIEEQRQWIARLEVELASVVRDRDASNEAAAAAQAEHIEQGARLAAANARVLELEGKALDQEHAISALREEPHVSLERARDLEAALHAAEDSIHRLEANLRIKSARLDELAKTHDDSRGTSAPPEVTPEGAAPLFIRTGESEVVHVLGRKTTIGRTPENDVQINAQYISRHHAVIIAGPTHTVIEDLNSTNGVIVNGRRVLRQTLKDGDIVLIGKAPFRFAMRPVSEGR
jgi:chromosome segregation ATPase